MKNKVTIGMILVILLTIGIIWVNGTPEKSILAQQENSRTDIIPKPGTTLEPGEVRTDKTAVPVPGMVNTWDVTLRVEGRDAPKTADIVLVFDTSWSMAGTKLVNAKAAAQSFVDNLLPSSPLSSTTRIALVTFGNNATTQLGFTNIPGSTSDVNTLKGRINTLTASGYTFTQGGLYYARNHLATSTADNKYIVLLSDGEPTRSCSNIADETNCTTQNPNDTFTVHTQRAIDQANLAKNTDGYIIYTIALDTTAFGTTTINSISSGTGYHYTADAGDLNTVFQTIANSIKSTMASAQATDPMGSGFTSLGLVYGVTISPNGGTVDATDPKNVIWNIPTLIEPIETDSDIRYAEITYRLEVDDTILTADPTVPGGDLFYTNANAVITYTGADGEPATKDFPDPIVDPVLLEVKKTLLDIDGNPVAGSDLPFNITITGPQNYNQMYTRKGGETAPLIANLRYEGVYTVSEAAMGNYLTTIKIDGTETSTFTVVKETAVDDEMDDIVVEVTNRLNVMNVSATKTWSGLLTGETPPALYFQLYQGATAYGDPKAVPTTEPRTVIWNDVPVANASGVAYVYTVKEGTASGSPLAFTAKVPDAFTSNPSGGECTVIRTGNSGVCAITNTRKTVDVTATKAWVGLAAGETAPELWFQLYQGATAYGDPQQVPTTDPRTVTWTSIPETDVSGVAYVYTVKEGTASGTPLIFTAKAPGGFTADPASGECTAVGTDDSRACTITNTRKTIDFSATKTWSGLLTGETAPALWFQLYQGRLPMVPHRQCRQPNRGL